MSANDEDDDDVDDNTPSTSEGEKFSGSDSESDGNELIKSTKGGWNAKNSTLNWNVINFFQFLLVTKLASDYKKSPKSSPEVRKRKPRKAD